MNQIVIYIFSEREILTCCVMYVRSCFVPRGYPSSKSYPTKFYSCHWESIGPSWCSLYYWCGGWTSYDWISLGLIFIRDYFPEFLSESFDEVLKLLQVRVYRDPDNPRIKFATIGTTAEVILQKLAANSFFSSYSSFFPLLIDEDVTYICGILCWLFYIFMLYWLSHYLWNSLSIC